MISFKIPDISKTEAFLKNQKTLDFTYKPLKGTALQVKIADFDNDFLKEKIGFGENDFKMARAAICQWQMFPLSWTAILPENAPIQEGVTIAMYAQFMGFWWRNACRIVYVIDENMRFGFAYGTLPGHIECGEELFLVEMDAEGNVFYTIKAFSRPRHILAKIAYPIMRRLQDQFRRDSAAQMRDYLIRMNKM